jgi:hypothetical protein
MFCGDSSLPRLNFFLTVLAEGSADVLFRFLAVFDEDVRDGRRVVFVLAGRGWLFAFIITPPNSGVPSSGYHILLGKSCNGD